MGILFPIHPFIIQIEWIHTPHEDVFVIDIFYIHFLILKETSHKVFDHLCRIHLRK